MKHDSFKINSKILFLCLSGLFLKILKIYNYFQNSENFNSHFVKDYFNIIKLLTKLIHENSFFENKKQKQTFCKFQKFLINIFILQFYDSKNSIKTKTNNPKFVIIICFIQFDNNQK